MQVQYQTMRVYNFADLSTSIDKLLQLKTSSGWDMRFKPERKHSKKG